jgi:hypothetical protein
MEPLWEDEGMRLADGDNMQEVDAVLKHDTRGRPIADRVTAEVKVMSRRRPWGAAAFAERLEHAPVVNNVNTGSATILYHPCSGFEKDNTWVSARPTAAALSHCARSGRCQRCARRRRLRRPARRQQRP